ncbi:DUF2239 family protein [Simplicispira suum]|jgi:hypothetical protein|uniref:DUF2239 domain-containing protein n=1 Tax=Simplicispira suum TaxID=2109915 RepID=A0A2S0N429_9BURK|nr:DUF2239 family protein [Simplicispira suum]AVO42902.1 DUF2239 domain-containing protein [Simplicispira suum]
MTATAQTLTAFVGFERIAKGSRKEVFAQLRQYSGSAPLLIFDDTNGALVDLDLREPAQEPTAAEAPRSVGRPKLGVVAREVTLLPRHWDWLGRQPGGASVALRRLVEEARRIHHGRDTVREAREAAYRFMTAMAGSLEGFEEAARALFAGDQERFLALVAVWPEDVGTYLQGLAAAAWSEKDGPT